LPIRNLSDFFSKIDFKIIIPMKKIIPILVILNAVLLPVISAIVPNPIISHGKPVFTSSGSASFLVDNQFNNASWNAGNNSWIAIQLDPGPTTIFFSWNNPSYAWSNELSPPQCPNSISFPIDYNLLVSSNSTNGADGDWTLADSIRGNIVDARGHYIDFTRASWIKMQILVGGGQIDEVEVFDASDDGDDVWFFAGTSISANAFKGTPPAQDYADVVNSNHSEYNPALIRGGIGCISSTDFVNNISKYLKMAGNAHFWAIEMGTNNAWGGTNGNVTVFKNNLQKVIDSCKAAGIEPIIARVLATNESAAGWQVHPDFLTAVDDLTAQNDLIPGPDLYTWFLAHPDELNSDGVHPNANGAASLQWLWTEKVDTLYGGSSEVHSFQLTPDHIKICPNPATEGSFSILSDPAEGTLQLQIFDMPGRLMYSTLIESRETIIHPNLPDGIYIVKFSNGQDFLNQKLVIQ
jgi:lysophospholipase L1-like esterase